MEPTIVRRPKPFGTGALDPAVERAWLLSEFDEAHEISVVVPRAEPEEGRNHY